MTKEQEDLVLSNVKFAYYVAHRFSASWDAMGLDRDDLYQTCLLALCKAALTYDSDRGEFPRYAYSVIANEVKMAIRRERRRLQRFPLSLDDIPVDLGPAVESPEADLLDVVAAAQHLRTTKRRLPLTAKRIVAALLSHPSYNERQIAEVVGCSQTYVNRALKRLRMQL